MLPKEKYGDIIVPSSNIEQLIDMVKRHYKFLKNEKKGKREIREIQHIMRGTLKDYPEYVLRKKVEKERELNASIGKSSVKATTTISKGKLWTRSAR